MFSPPLLCCASRGSWFFILCELITILSLVIPLLFAVSAKGGGVLWTGLGLGFLEASEFLLKVLEVVGLLLDKSHEALVGGGEGGIV